MSNLSSNERTDDVSSDDQMEHQDLISDEEHDHTVKPKKRETSLSSHKSRYNQQFKLEKKVTTTRLVSYDDEDDDVPNGSFDDEASREMNSIASEKNEEPLLDENNMCSLMQELVSHVPSMVEPFVDKPYMGHGVELPSEPLGKCPRQMQEKVTELYNKMMRDGKNMNRSIQTTKNFCNPSIYEKLLEFLDIDEKGTNYPPELYNPGIWGPDSYYEELAKAQRIEMERREKDKKDGKKDKTVIEKSQGTKKSKTKWDDPSANSSNPA